VLARAAAAAVRDVISSIAQLKPVPAPDHVHEESQMDNATHAADTDSDR